VERIQEKEYSSLHNNNQCYNIGIASEAADVSPNTPKADEANL
jgi:hypothetical protein